MGRKWCLNCEQFVEPKKNFYTIVFVLLIVFVWLPLLNNIYKIETGSYQQSGSGMELNPTWSGDELSFQSTVPASLSNVYYVTNPILVGIKISAFAIMFFVPLVYILYYLYMKETKCPICNGTNFTETNPKTAKKLE